MQRPSWIVAAAMSTFAMVVGGFPTTARAGFAIYGWQPLAGGGSATSYPGNQTTNFVTSDASVAIGYDPSNLASGFIDVASGSPGYAVTANANFHFVAVSPGAILIAATGLNGQSATVGLSGDVGPLDGQGRPESLASLFDGMVSASAQGGYHDEFSFTVSSNQGGGTVPEPSGLVLGLIATVLAAAWHRRSRSATARPCAATSGRN